MFFQIPKYNIAHLYIYICCVLNLDHLGRFDLWYLRSRAKLLKITQFHDILFHSIYPQQARRNDFDIGWLRAERGEKLIPRPLDRWKTPLFYILHYLIDKQMKIF